MRKGLKILLFAGVASQAVLAVAASPILNQQIAARLATNVLTTSAPAEIDAQCAATLKLGARARSALEARRGAATMAQDFRAYDNLGRLFGDVGSEMYLVGQTSTLEPVRKAAEACVTRISDLSTQIGLSRPIYERLTAIRTKGLDDKSRFTLNKQLINFRLAGVDKDAATRAKVIALQKQLTDIGLAFDGNIRDDKGDLAFTPAELAGLPQDWLDARKPQADGKIHVTRDYPDFVPINEFATSRETRRRASIFYRNRGYPKNEAVLGQLIAKRYEFAQLLGFTNFAAYATVDKMIGSPARATAFIDEAKAASDAAAEADKAELLVFGKTVDPSIARLEGYDYAYLSNKLRKAKYDVDSAEVRQYFTYTKARQGIFGLVHDLFGADIRPWKTKVWAPDVSAWELYDKGALVGRFYLDMHPRDGKYSHAAQFGIRTGVAGTQVPTAALVANFPATGPMDHDDVGTFLHEFGHLIHSLYSGRVQYGTQSMNGLQWDFIEAPSQLLEEWVWDYDTLRRFASNDKRQVIPQALVAKMNAGRGFGEAIDARGQLAYSAASMAYYNRAPGFDLKSVFDEQMTKYGTFPVIPESHAYAGFNHLNGYSAIYYTYVWSKAIALDLFTSFKAAGIRNPEVAMRYRHQVLDQGGSKDANVLIEDFLGRPLSLQAYKDRLTKNGSSE